MKKNPLDFKTKWEEDEWRAQMAKRAEERRNYLNNLFHLPTTNLAEPDYIIEGLLPEGYLAILAGDPKVGKTFLATAIALAITNGTDFAGLRTKPGGVLWLSLEESPAERAQAIGTLAHLKSITENWTDEQQEKAKDSNGPPLTDYAQLPLYTCYEPIAIDTEAGLDALGHWLSRARAKLIVVDPLHAAHSGRSLSDGWAARRTLQPLKQFCAFHRVTALVLHHLGNRNGKPRVAENAQLSAVASMFMLLTQSPFRVSPEMRKGFGDGDPESPARLREGLGEGSPDAERHTSDESERSDPSEKSDSPTENRKLKTENHPRSFTLTCQGRGAFANRTWQFQSKSPWDYKIVSTGGYEIPSVGKSIETSLLRLLGSSNAYSSSLLVRHLRFYSEGAVRNAISRLFKRGALTRERGREGEFEYKLRINQEVV